MVVDIVWDGLICILAGVPSGCAHQSHVGTEEECGPVVTRHFRRLPLMLICAPSVACLLLLPSELTL